MTGERLVFRPHKSRIVASVAAGVMFVLFTLLAIVVRLGAAGSSAPGNAGTGAPARPFQIVDRVGLFALGVAVAGAVLLFARPRVVADTEGVTVRNLVRTTSVPWGVVAAVRFNRDTPWAMLELHDDDRLAVMAIQQNDGSRAIEAFVALKRLHAASAGPGSPERE